MGIGLLLYRAHRANFLSFNWVGLVRAASARRDNAWDYGGRLSISGRPGAYKREADLGVRIAVKPVGRQADLLIPMGRTR